MNQAASKLISKLDSYETNLLMKIVQEAGYSDEEDLIVHSALQVLENRMQPEAFIAFTDSL